MDDGHLDDLADRVIAVMHTQGINPEPQRLLDLAYRILRDVIDLPAMHDATRIPFVVEAVDRAAALTDVALFLTPRDHLHARQQLSGLIDKCLFVVSSFEKEGIEL